jgi:hypothetical protein
MIRLDAPRALFALLATIAVALSSLTGARAEAGEPADAPPPDPAWPAFVAELSSGAHPEPGYRFYDELHAQIAEVVALYPGRVRPFSLGATVQGAPIWGFRCSDPMTPIQKKMLVFGAIHPLEWASSEVVTDALLACARRPPPGVLMVFVPVLNVDGRRTVENDLMSGNDRYRRGNAAGVDLNRDFTSNRESKAIWRHIIPSRYSTSPAPLSQPESRAIDALAAAERFDVAMSFHAFGGYFYYPWAGRWERPKDRAEFVALGHLMEEAQPGRPYRTQQLSHWAFFFRGCGMELDHLYERYDTRAFLIELTRSGVSPWRPWTWDQHFRLYNPADPSPDAASGAAAVRAMAWHLAGAPR